MCIIWQKSLDILEKSINPIHVRTLLTPLQAHLGSDGLTLCADNGFAVSWIANRYQGAIEQAVRQVSDRDVPVRIVCAVQGGGNGPAGRAAESGALLPVKAGVREDSGQALGSTAAITGTSIGENGRIERRVPQRAYQRALPLPAAAPLPMTAPVNHMAGSRPEGGLNGAGSWRYSFKDFVVGPSNELAFSAARSICRQQLVTDQFYVCSAPGLGKTHLLQAIGQELSTNGGSKQGRVRLAYLTAEDFACRMVMALKQREMESFKAGLRDGVDILLLEDIHFLQGKEKTQEELLATVKSLRSHGKKVVFTSSFLPKEMPKLDSLLASQFCDGFMAVIDKPDFNTRMRILENKARVFQVPIPHDVNELFANTIHSDIRLLENCLQNLVIKARLMNQHINRDLAMEVLKNYAPTSPKPDLETITAFICRSFNLSHDSLRTKSRKKEYVLARNSIFYLARKHTELSLKNIGEAFNRKHSSVIKGITQMEREMSRQSTVGRQVDRLIQTLEAQTLGHVAIQ
ncbi:DnaA ATPase domain-containing protein [Desulfonatronum thiodismutans]|uniref:DnaA ATPase domain-containing protein n=1 Tax=Desulfonatronum thiodismutans TaxID=159290 RepID=UPI0004ABEE54|nr:DnaA/Hda family protein [Desulfonatronum thiodismutans]